MTSTRTGWSFTALQFDVLTAVLRLDSLPSPIEVRGHGRTQEERVRNIDGAQVPQPLPATAGPAGRWEPLN